MKKSQIMKTVFRRAMPMLLCLLMLCSLLPAKANAEERLNVHFHLNSEEQQYEAGWNAITGAVKYKIYIGERMSADAESYIQIGVNRSVDGTSAVIPLSAFTDYRGAWWEDPQDDFVVTISAYDKSEACLIEEDTIFRSTGIPKLSAPENVKLSRSGSVTWTAVPGAEKYSARLYRRDGTEWTFVKQKTVSGAECGFAEYVEPEKEYKALVQAGAEGYRHSARTESGSAVFDGVSVEHDEADGRWTFRWKSFAGAGRYRLSVYEKMSSDAAGYEFAGYEEEMSFSSSYGDGILLSTQQGNAFTAGNVAKEDRQDSFIVKIEALGQNGEVLGSKETAPFSTGIPKLKGPDNVKLDNNGVLTWDTVTAANNYYVVLYREHNGSWEKVTDLSGAFSAGGRTDLSSYMEPCRTYRAGVLATHCGSYISGTTAYSSAMIFHAVHTASAAIPEPVDGIQAGIYDRSRATMTTEPAGALEHIESAVWYCRTSELVGWTEMKDSETFTEGKYYGVEIKGILKNDYVAAEEDMEVTLNGKEANGGGSLGQELVIWYDFGKLTCTEHSTVGITFQEPEHGKLQPDDRTVSILPDTCELDMFDWSYQYYDEEDSWRPMEEEQTFEAGVYYRLDMSFVLYGGRLKTGGTITINGKTVPADNIEITNGGRNFRLYYVWRAGTPIKKITVRTETPAAGKAIPTNENVTVCAYTENDVPADGVGTCIEWGQKKEKSAAGYTQIVEDDAVFEEDLFYRMWCTFTREEGYYIAEDVVGYLNGEKIDSFYEDESQAAIVKDYNDLAQPYKTVALTGPEPEIGASVNKDPGVYTLTVDGKEKQFSFYANRFYVYNDEERLVNTFEACRKGLIEALLSHKASSSLQQYFDYGRVDKNTAVTYNGKPASIKAYSYAIVISYEFALSNTKGDINMDGSVDIRDVSLLFRWWNGKQALGGQELVNGDINEDGAVDLMDAAALFRGIS